VCVFALEVVAEVCIDHHIGGLVCHTTPPWFNWNVDGWTISDENYQLKFCEGMFSMLQINTVQLDGQTESSFHKCSLGMWKRLKVNLRQFIC